MNPRFWIATYHNNNRRAAADDRNTPLPILRFIAEAPDSDAHEVAAVASREDLVADLYYWLFDNQERWNFAEAMWNPMPSWKRWPVIQPSLPTSA